MPRASVTVSIASPPSSPSCTACNGPIDGLLLSFIREDLSSSSFSIERLHPPCASPMQSLMAVPLASVQLIDGYAELSPSSQLSLFSHLTPLLLQAVQFAAEDDSAGPLRQTSTLVDRSQVETLSCPSCHLLLREAVTLSCCDSSLCELCWMKAHLTKGELLQRTESSVTAIVDCVNSPRCSKTVHIGQVAVNRALQSQVDSAIVQCSEGECGMTFALKEAESHRQECESAWMTCEGCGAKVRREAVKDHGRTCTGQLMQDGDSDDEGQDGMDGEEGEEEDSGDSEDEAMVEEMPSSRPAENTEVDLTGENDKGSQALEVPAPVLAPAGGTGSGDGLPGERVPLEEIKINQLGEQKEAQL